MTALDLVDSHCHLNFEALAADLDNVLARARDNGVGHMLSVCVALETFSEIWAIADTHRNVFASVGVHPNEHEGRDPSARELVALAADDRVVAIGETGLDYYRSQGNLTWQQSRFREHIRAARECAKPLIIHTRDAGDDTLRIMAEEDAGIAGGVMHCFTDSWKTARRALDLGFYISFSGIVTFKNAEALRDVAKRVPDERIMIETDAPYLAPVPHRGKTNEPAFVRHVAECLAEVRGVPFASFADQTTRNFFSLFRRAIP